MDVSAPGFGMPPFAGLTLGLEGALKSTQTQSTPWPTGVQASFEQALQPILAPAAADVPIVSPPTYSSVAAGATLSTPASAPTWLSTLNFDPRYRAAAAMGGTIVSASREALMASAWDQFEAVRRANQVLRQMQLGREVSVAVFARQLKTVNDPGTLLQMLRPAQPRLRLGGASVTLFSQLASSRVAQGAVSGALRRLARPRGPVGRVLFSAATPQLRIVERLNAATGVSGALLVAMPRIPPNGTVLLESVAPTMTVAKLDPTIVNAAPGWFATTAATASSPETGTIPTTITPVEKAAIATPEIATPDIAAGGAPVRAGGGGVTGGGGVAGSTGGSNPIQTVGEPIRAGGGVPDIPVKGVPKGPVLSTGAIEQREMVARFRAAAGVVTTYISTRTTKISDAPAPPPLAADLLRLGRQPYGVLPVVASGSYQSLSGDPLPQLFPLLMKLRAYWNASVSAVARVAAGADPDATLTSILSQSPFSTTYAGRSALGPQFSAYYWPFVGQSIDASWFSTLTKLSTQSLGADSATVAPTRLANTTFLDSHFSLVDGIVDTQTSDAPLQNNYLTALGAMTLAQLQTTTPPANPSPLLWLLVRHAALRQYVQSAYDLLGPAVQDADRVEPELIDLSPGATTPRVWDQLAMTTTATGPVGTYLDQHKMNGPAGFVAFWTALASLATMSTNSLDSALRETIDLCSYRLDAWFTSLASQRLDTLRKQTGNAQTLYIGAYGWVENVKPKSAVPSWGYVLREFALIYGNDWFVIPLQVASGSIAQIASLVVTDTFGVTTSVPHYTQTPDGGKWRMFAVSGDVAPHRLVVIPAMSGGLSSDPLEQIVLMRDEAAQMAWGVEQIVAGASGQSFTTPATSSSLPATSNASAPSVRYQLGSSVPDSYIPFVPAAGDGTQTQMRRAAFREIDGTSGEVDPRGQVLAGSSPVYEEEFAREGVKVVRRYRLARGTDGSTYVWLARRKTIGATAPASGLAFDQVLEE